MTAGVVPTGDGLACVWAGTPSTRFAHRRSASLDSDYRSLLAEADPQLAASIGTAAPVGTLRAFPGQPGLDPRQRGPGLGAGRRRRLLQRPHHRARHHRRAAGRGATRPRGSAGTARRAGPTRGAARVRAHPRSALGAAVRHHRTHRELRVGSGRATRAPRRVEPGHAGRGRRTPRARHSAGGLTDDADVPDQPAASADRPRPGVGSQCLVLGHRGRAQPACGVGHRVDGRGVADGLGAGRLRHRCNHFGSVEPRRPHQTAVPARRERAVRRDMHGGTGVVASTVFRRRSR